MPEVSTGSVPSQQLVAFRHSMAVPRVLVGRNALEGCPRYVTICRCIAIWSEAISTPSSLQAAIAAHRERDQPRAGLVDARRYAARVVNWLLHRRVRPRGRELAQQREPLEMPAHDILDDAGGELDAFVGSCGCGERRVKGRSERRVAPRRARRRVPRWRSAGPPVMRTMHGSVVCSICMDAVE